MIEFVLVRITGRTPVPCACREHLIPPGGAAYRGMVKGRERFLTPDCMQDLAKQYPRLVSSSLLHTEGV